MSLKKYFYFSKREKRGVFMLIALIIILFSVRITLSYAVANKQKLEQVKTNNQISQFDSLYIANNTSKPKTSYTKKTASQSRKTITSTTEKINIDERANKSQASNNKVRAVKYPAKQYSKSKYSVKTNDTIELNGADTTKLKMLKGIGSGFAKRIIAYRNKLGGFYSTEQLLEVYYFEQEMYDNIQHQIVVDTALIKKIAVNEASIYKLKSHPYIGYYQARALFDMRNKSKGKRLDSIDEIKIIGDIDSAFVNKMQYYFSFK